jgi:L-xylulokinase
MRGWHTKFDLAATVIEGVVFNHKHHFDMLSETLDTSKRIIATGGSMQSKVWAQLVADVFNREIVLSDTQESGARGIAMLAGVATGQFSSIQDAISKCVRVKGSVKPNPERVKLFADRYLNYRAEAKKLINV